MILRTIHIGVTGRGQWLLDAISNDPKFRPVALVDSNTVAAKTAQYRLAAERVHKGVPIFSVIAGAVSQLEADAAVICTPTRTHAEYARMAIIANLHCLIDTAMTPDFADAASLVGEADTAWLKLA